MFTILKFSKPQVVVKVLPLFLFLSTVSLASDRPQGPEPNPITSERNNFILELYPVAFTDFKSSGEVSASETSSGLRLRYGLSDNLELQVLWSYYSHSKNENSELNEILSSSSTNNPSVGFKYNFIGNDEGSFAFALNPFVELPFKKVIENERKFIWGIFAPASYSFTDRLVLEVTPSIENYFTETIEEKFTFSNYSVLNYDVSDRLGVFTDLLVTTQSGLTYTTFGVGFNWAFTDNLVFELNGVKGLGNSPVNFQVLSNILFLFKF